jgi:prolyl-tRNA synthetase
VTALMDEIQANIFRKATAFREENTWRTDSWEEFCDIIENRGGFVMAHWDGSSETEEKIKDLTKATIRVLPFNAPEEEGKCILSGKPSHRRVLFARAY